MANNWYHRRAGATAGPYSAAELRKLAVDGRIVPDDWVRRGDQGPWGLASRVKGLFSDMAGGATTTYLQSTDSSAAATFGVPSGERTVAASEAQTVVVAPAAAFADAAGPVAVRFLGRLSRRPYVLLTGLLAAGFCAVLVFHGRNTGGGGLVRDEGVDGKEEETAKRDTTMPENASEKGGVASGSVSAVPISRPAEITANTVKEVVAGAKEQPLKPGGIEVAPHVADPGSKKAQAEPPRQELATRESQQTASSKDPVQSPEPAKEKLPKPQNPAPPQAESEELEQRLARLTELYGQLKKSSADQETGAKELAELDREQKRLQTDLTERNLRIQNIRLQIEAINAQENATLAQLSPKMRNQAVLAPQIEQSRQFLTAQGSALEGPIPSLRNSLDQVEAKLAVVKKLMQELDKDVEQSIPETFWLCDPFGRLPKQSHLRCRRLCSLWIAADLPHWLPFLARGFAYAGAGDHKLAFQDLDKAGRLEVRLAPFVAGGRALVLSRVKSPQATAEFAKARKAFKPKSSIIELFLGHAAAAQGRDTAAEQFFRHAIGLDKNCPQAHDSLAYFLATRRAVDRGSGKRAIQDAMIACELTKWREWVYLDTLAIACAANGDFELAVGWAKKSIDRAPPQYRTLLQERLESFQQNKPYKLE